MPNIEFIKTKFLDVSDKTRSIATFSLNGKLIDHPFWYSCISVYGKDGTKLLLTARVLYEEGFMSEAHEVLKPHANGSIIRDENDNLIDQRNWQQIWLDDNPILDLPVIPEIDPLL